MHVLRQRSDQWIQSLRDSHLRTYANNCAFIPSIFSLRCPLLVQERETASHKERAASLDGPPTRAFSPGQMPTAFARDRCLGKSISTSADTESTQTIRFPHAIALVSQRRRSGEEID